MTFEKAFTNANASDAKPEKQRARDPPLRTGVLLCVIQAVTKNVRLAPHSTQYGKSPHPHRSFAYRSTTLRSARVAAFTRPCGRIARRGGFPHTGGDVTAHKRRRGLRLQGTKASARHPSRRPAERSPRRAYRHEHRRLAGATGRAR